MIIIVITFIESLMLSVGLVSISPVAEGMHQAQPAYLTDRNTTKVRECRSLTCSGEGGQERSCCDLGRGISRTPATPPL